MRLYRFEAAREPGAWTTDRAPGLVFHTTQYTPNELCKKFLSVKPRPRIDQLKYVLEPLGSEARKTLDYYFRNHSYRKWLQDKKPEVYKQYEELLQKETQKRREYMQKVIQWEAESQEKEKEKQVITSTSTSISSPA